MKKYVNNLNNDVEKQEFDDDLECIQYILQCIGIGFDYTPQKYGTLEQKLSDNFISVLREWIEVEKLMIEEDEGSYTSDELDCDDPYEIYQSFKLVGD